METVLDPFLFLLTITEEEDPKFSLQIRIFLRFGKWKCCGVVTISFGSGFNFQKFGFGTAKAPALAVVHLCEHNSLKI
jgi:hypothetical protein